MDRRACSDSGKAIYTAFVPKPTLRRPATYSPSVKRIKFRRKRYSFEPFNLDTWIKAHAQEYPDGDEKESSQYDLTWLYTKMYKPQMPASAGPWNLLGPCNLWNEALRNEPRACIAYVACVRASSGHPEKLLCESIACTERSVPRCELDCIAT